MKKKILLLNLMLLIGFISQSQELSPFLSSTVVGNIDQISQDVEAQLNIADFEVLGKYMVAGQSDLQVICFTREDLKSVCEKYEDRGALASVLKIGLRKINDTIELSLLQPKYMFYAYFGEDYKTQEIILEEIDEDAKSVLSRTYGQLADFGGSLDIEDLKKYHYKVMMPYFDDPIVLEEYESFEEGLSFIRKKITESKQAIQLVFELVNESDETAVFGIGLLEKEMGEGKFLPIIGERHIAAMPYEIILQGNEVSMLHGKYRFALYWPELTMGTFMKIMSTPGDVEDVMGSLTEKE